MSARVLLFALLAPALVFAQAKPPSGGSSGASGVTTVGAFGSSPAAGGASISSTTLTMQPYDSTHPGEMSTGAQTAAGDKTWTGTMIDSIASGSFAWKQKQGAKMCFNSDNASPCGAEIHDDGTSLSLTARFGMKLFSGSAAATVDVPTSGIAICTNCGNKITITGSTTGNPVTLTAAGDANLDISLVPAGTGITNSTGFHATASTSAGQVTCSGGTGTATVRSGCKALCTNTSSGTAPQCSVSSTTLTVTAAGSDVVNYFCF